MTTSTLQPRRSCKSKSRAEWSNSERIANKEKIEHINIPLDEKDVLNIFNNLDLATNDTTDLWYEFPLREIAQKKNIRTMLSGWGGDDFITFNGRGYYSGYLYFSAVEL